MAKLWGSRFKKKTDPLADIFTFSIDYDRKLALYDVLGSMAHALMLGKTGIISKKDAAAIVKGLERIADQIRKDRFRIDGKAEDIHTLIQSRLKKLIGLPADRLHTARSRNDQVVLDTKMYCLDESLAIIALLEDLQKALVACAQKYETLIIPAYTHQQDAQLVLAAHHLLAYVEMADRDKGRLLDAQKRIAVLPLGSGAVSGTSLAIDRKFTASLLEFAQVSANSMDAVSDRDFIIEMLADLAIIAVHLSRLAQDLILWSDSAHQFVDIDWAYCTGSSIMPHKKNPDVCELIRANASTVSGNLMKVLNLLKGLPLTYHRDLQLDKQPLFESVQQIRLMTALMAKMMQTLRFREQAIADKCGKEHFYSVDLMEYLIKKGLPYRQSHDTVGRIVKECLDKGKGFSSLTLKEWRRYSDLFSEDVKKLFNPLMSVKIKRSFGSTNPKLVHKQISRWKNILHA